jgi:hypothetical protein
MKVAIVRTQCTWAPLLPSDSIKGRCCLTAGVTDAGLITTWWRNVINFNSPPSSPPPRIVMVPSMNRAVTWWRDYFSKNKYCILLACRQWRHKAVWQCDYVTRVLLLIPSRRQFHRFGPSPTIVSVTKSDLLRDGRVGNKNITQIFNWNIAWKDISFGRRRNDIKIDDRELCYV